MMISETLVSLILLGLLAFRVVHLTPWVADAFFVGVFGQVVGLAHIVVTHLFPADPWFPPE